jgi:hypothetical protein
MELLAAAEAWGPVAALRASRWTYAAVSAAHVAGVGLLFGAVAALDLRLLGLWRGAALEPLARVLADLAAAGLALAGVSGLALFAARAGEYVANPAFQIKAAVVALGVANALALRAAGWPPAGRSRRVRAGAALSLAAWSGAILAGRLIAFV